MTKSTITRERIQRIIRAINSEAYDEEEIREWLSSDEIMELSRMALAAMDSEPVEMPLDYLQGHKDGLEWASQLAEANHPETGDWLYDDPIELAKAIRKGPDMPPVQPVADSEPVIVVGDDGGDALSYRRLIQSFEPGTKLYLHAQPAPEYPETLPCPVLLEPGLRFGKGIKTSTMLAALARRAVHESDMAALSPEERVEFQARIEDFKALIAQPAPAVPGKWIPVSERMPENDGAYLCWDNRYVTTYAFIFGAWQANQFVAKNITHWMPLPNPPKE
ncbi:TPA: DUF551 domain-containing protein [Klebsiella pneumoniae]